MWVGMWCVSSLSVKGCEDLRRRMVDVGCLQEVRLGG